MAIFRKIAIALVVILVLAAGGFWFLSRGDTADLSVEEVAGTEPVLQEGDPQSFPTVQIAEPVGWQKDEAPTPAEGLEVVRFAEGLDHPRILYALPNGDVLVTLTRAPKPEGNGGGGIMATIEGWIAAMLFEKAGSAGESPNQIVLLRDEDGNGSAEKQVVILEEGLDSPSGMGWLDGTLYVANHNAVLAFPYELGSETVSGSPRKLMDLPAGGNHWMRNLEIAPDGTRLFVAVGSASNIGERGMEAEEGRAMIWEYNLESDRQRQFAVGLRNANGMDFSPWTGELWTTVNERDMLGSDVVHGAATSEDLQEAELVGSYILDAGAASSSPPAYMDSTIKLYFSSTTFRFNLRVGVNSPVATVKSAGRSVHLLTRWAREVDLAFARLMPA